jgi:hypothetical protein
MHWVFTSCGTCCSRWELTALCCCTQHVVPEPHLLLLAFVVHGTLVGMVNELQTPLAAMLVAQTSSSCLMACAAACYCSACYHLSCRRCRY